MSTDSLDVLLEAYRKFKSYAYYDRTNLLYRDRIVEFETATLTNNGKLHQSSESETPINQKLYILLKALREADRKFFKKLVSKINIVFLPKKIDPLYTNDANFITNQRIANNYNIKRATAFIDAPAEIYIISILWLMKYGYQLDRELYDCCSGNRLILNKDKTGITSGSALYKPYYKQYQKWRDDAFTQARTELDKGQNIAILNLDIRNYFYSVKLDFKELSNFLSPSPITDILHEIFINIHNKYTDELRSKNFPHPIYHNEKEEPMLPIGLPSSYVLANWYMSKFDHRIHQKIRPAFYGRYVDDILIVLKDPDFEFYRNETCEELKLDIYPEKTENINRQNCDKPSYLEQFIIETLHPLVYRVRDPDQSIDQSTESTIRNTTDSDQRCVFKITCIEGLYFQSDKTLLYFFDHNESTGALDKLKHDIEERASEFRDFPDDDSDKMDFNTQAYHLIFDGTEGKIRTLKDYQENRYGLSIFLAQRIFVALRRNKKNAGQDSIDILRLFQGLNVLTYYSLWEKILTYFLVNDDVNSFISFQHNVLQEVLKLELPNQYVSNTDLTYDNLCSSLIKHLILATKITISLHPTFLRNNIKNKVTREILTSLQVFLTNQIEKASVSLKEKLQLLQSLLFSPDVTPSIYRFRESNMLRHDYVARPLRNYIVASISPENKNEPKDSSIENLLQKKINIRYPFLISDNQKFNSPKRIYFWECCIHVLDKKIFGKELPLKLDNNRYELVKQWNQNNELYLNEALELYKDVNCNHMPKAEFDARIENICTIDSHIISSSFRPSQNSGEHSNIHLNHIAIKGEEKLDKVRVAFVNTQVNNTNIENGLRGITNLDTKRYNQLADILNQTRKEQADILLCPECYIPNELLPTITKFSAANQIAIVTGMEHYNVDGIAYNFITTILPFKYNGIKDAAVFHRLKNHYAPSEEVLIKKFGYRVPKADPYHYYTFQWKGLYFAPFYCFELADLYHRSLFRSAIDFLVVCEWNMDTHYFSDIIGSLSRDIHAYIAQVNTCQYGDSRLLQPKKSEEKNLISLKGGLNDIVLIGEIDLKSLRDFQMMYGEAGGKDNSSFKPVPPDFDRQLVQKRIDNKPLFKE